MCLMQFLVVFLSDSTEYTIHSYSKEKLTMEDGGKASRLRNAAPSGCAELSATRLSTMTAMIFIFFKLCF